MAEDASGTDINAEIGAQKGAAPEWVVEMAIEEADGWIEEEIRGGSSFAFSDDDIGYLAIRMGAVAGLANVPTSDAAQAKALEMFRVAAGRDAVGAAIAWAVATDIPLPAKALEEAGVMGLPRAVTDHQRQSRHDPTRQVLYGNAPAVSYSGELTIDAVQSMRGAFYANAGKFGSSLRIGAEAEERAQEAANELLDTSVSWPAGLALDPELIGQLADVVTRTQGLTGFEPSEGTRDLGREVLRGFIAGDPKGAALAWAMGTDRPLPRDLFMEAGLTDLPKELGPQSFREEHARARTMLSGQDVDRAADYNLEAVTSYSLRAFDKGRNQDNSIVPNEATARSEFESWLERNPSPLPGAAPSPLSHEELGQLADVVGLTVGLKKIPTSDASREMGLYAFQRAAERDPQGAVIAWTLGTDLAPPKTLNLDRQPLQVPREVTEHVREGQYRRTQALLAGAEPATSHSNAFTYDAIDGMRRGFAKTGDAPVSAQVVERGIEAAWGFTRANAERWGTEHDPHFSAEEIGEIRDMIGTTVGLRKRPTSADGYEAGVAAFETALQRDPAGAMIAWAKATDLPLPHDALERRGIESVPREIVAFQAKSAAHGRTSALLDGVPPPAESSATSYIETAINGELRRAAEKHGIDDLTPEKLRRQIEDAHRKAVDARKRATDQMLKTTRAPSDDSGAFLVKDMFNGFRAGRRFREMISHRRDRATHEKSLAAAVARGRMRVSPASVFERVPIAAADQGLTSTFSRFAARVTQGLQRDAQQRQLRADQVAGMSID